MFLGQIAEFGLSERGRKRLADCKGVPTMAGTALQIAGAFRPW